MEYETAVCLTTYSHHPSHSLRCKLSTILSEGWLLNCVALKLKEEIQGIKVVLSMPSWRRKEFGWERVDAAHAFFL